MGIDSFIYDHESSWGDTGNEIPEMLKYYEYHTQKQHS
jgi:hypothetical protein